MNDMTEQERDEIIKIAVEEAPSVIDRFEQEGHPFYRGEDESAAELGSRLFDVVLPAVDNHSPELSRFEAALISDICYEVAWDIIHGDILGNLVDYREEEVI
jgi:hypothetical protein